MQSANGCGHGLDIRVPPDHDKQQEVQAMTDFSARPTEGAPTKPVDCPLLGEDGNAFFIMGRLDKALQRAGASPEYRKAVQADMTSGDYDHLVGVAIREIDGKV